MHFIFLFSNRMYEFFFSSWIISLSHNWILCWYGRVLSCDKESNLIRKVVDYVCMSWIVQNHFSSQFSWSLKNNVLGLVVEISCSFQVHKGIFESCHTYTTICWESILYLSEQDILHVKFSGLSFHQRLSHTKKLQHL